MTTSCFRFSPEKFTEAVVYVLSMVRSSPRMKIVKLLYFADRHHVVCHGTPILGDRYYRLPYGPVPSRGLDLLEAIADIAAKREGVYPDAVSEALLERIVVESPESKYPNYALKGSPSQVEEHLSQAEVESLTWAVAKFGGLTGPKLSALSLEHDAYKQTKPGQEIDYRLFFSDEPEASPEALQYLESTQDDRALVEYLRS